MSTRLTARHRVLAYLRKARFASVREIARALNMSAPNVRHHLAVLQSDDRVEVNLIQRQEGRGRPQNIYCLSQSALGDNLALLADVLLIQSLQLEAVAERMVSLGGLNTITSQPLPRRLSWLIEKMNSMHYQARWEAGARGPRLIFGHCPFASIIHHHPELCRLDQLLLQKALGAPVSQIARPESPVRSSCPHFFQIG